MATSGIDSSIPLRVQAPEIWGRLNQVLAAKRQTQEIAQGAIDLKERQNVAQVISSGKAPDGSSVLDANGDPDPDKLGRVIAQVAPTTGQAIMQQVQDTHAKTLALRSSAGKLAGEQRDALSGVLRTHLSNPNVTSADVNASLERYADDNPAAADVVRRLEKHTPLLDQAQDKQKFIGRLITELQPAGTTAEQQQQAQPVSTGGAIHYTQRDITGPNAGITSLGTAPVTLGPGETETPFADQLGNWYVSHKDASGRVLGVRPLQNGGGGTGGPARFGAGEKAAIEKQTETNNENIKANREAASLVPQQVDQINKALALTKEADTGGSWTSTKANIESTIGNLIPGFGSLKTEGDKLNELNKFLERISAGNSQILGGTKATTDAARESIARQSAQLGYGTGAIRAVLNYAKAQTVAVQAKADAQEQWLHQAGNSPGNQHEFETKWRQSYDPVLFQLKGASADEQQRIIKSISPAEARSLKGKMAALEALGVKF
jgi:hypothetical protein